MIIVNDMFTHISFFNDKQFSQNVKNVLFFPLANQ